MFGMLSIHCNVKRRKIRLPNLPELDRDILLTLDHFEHDNSHYDAIVLVTIGKVSLHHPTLLTHNEL